MPHAHVERPTAHTRNFYVASSLRMRLEEDLADERHAIHSLREMIPLLASDDAAARPLIEAILATEERRANELSDLLDGIRH